MTGIEHKTSVAMAGEHVEPANSDADTASTPGRPDVGGKSALASRLETISSKAVEKLDEIMGLPLDPDHPAFAPVLRAQTAAANTALSTQAKVDETALRKQEHDRMPELLRLAAEVRARLPPWLELEKPRNK